jgi:hypothetical protein
MKISRDNFACNREVQRCLMTSGVDVGLRYSLADTNGIIEWGDEFAFVKGK